MAVMVTGGTGFIGSRLVRKLVRRGEDVVVFDWRVNFRFIEDVRDNVEFVQGIVTNFDETVNTIKLHNVASIYHTAALLSGVAVVVPLRAA
jgi:UDP-glucose 4-epimerase